MYQHSHWIRMESCYVYEGLVTASIMKPPKCNRNNVLTPARTFTCYALSATRAKPTEF